MNNNYCNNYCNKYRNYISEPYISELLIQYYRVNIEKFSMLPKKIFLRISNGITRQVVNSPRLHKNRVPLFVN